MDKAALVDLLHEINAKSPPKPELVVKLGKMIAAEPAFFDVKGGVNRFDRAGYGYSAQVKREPIYLLVFVVACAARGCSRSTCASSTRSGATTRDGSRARRHEDLPSCPSRRSAPRARCSRTTTKPALSYGDSIRVAIAKGGLSVVRKNTM
jgi:hypothetical protein